MYRIVFMGTPAFAVPSLQSLLDTQQVVGVVTQPDRPAGRGKQLRPAPVKQLAVQAGLPLYQPNSLRQPELADPISAWQPDAIVVAAYGQILRAHLLALPRIGCYNVHASLLPRWRGAAPIQHAILAGDAFTGITLMGMDVGLDTGPMFAQEQIPILADDTAATIHDQLAKLGGTMLARYLDDMLAGVLPAKAQDESLATYAPMIRKEMGRIDWRRPAVDIMRQIRAMTPWPSAFTSWHGEQLKILSARVRSEIEHAGAVPGTAIRDQDAVVIITGDGALELHEVQLAGKRSVAMDAFVRGRPDFVGSRLGDDE